MENSKFFNDDGSHTLECDLVKNFGELLVECLRKKFEYNKNTVIGNIDKSYISFDETLLKEKRYGWYVWVLLKRSKTKYKEYGCSIDITFKEFTNQGYKSEDLEKITQDIKDKVGKYLYGK